ncbi:MAG TPA: M14 family zinc carboxypeptidase, partial [Streptosporangiales bacterium]
MTRAALRRSLALATAAALGGALAAGGAAARPTPARADTATCSPVGTAPDFRGRVPTPKQVLGFDLGSQEATNEQLNRYLHVLDGSSSRLVTGTFAHTATGRPLEYGLISRPGNLTRPALARLSRDAQRLRDPDLSKGEAARIVAHMPVILWLTGNVHGNEPAAGDAIVQLAYELADRDDCVANRILDHAVVGIIPSQNPDGRAANTRTNAYAFDMNRDWFARTQDETSGKLDLLETYPPQLYVDEHGMGGNGYFFPPNADPIYHETSDQSVDWIDNVYGTANAASFDAMGWSYETYQAGYDLFYQGYGDSVPTTEFGAAGMTFEVGQRASYPDQTAKHRLSGLTALFSGASNRGSILEGWHRAYVEAKQEGEACSLQPNQVYNPGHTVEQPVPDIRVCGYLLRYDPGKARELATVVRRLQLADVDVYALKRPVRVPDYTAYGRATKAATLPAGTLWIPMAQGQKHWIQAMLNENTYVPFPYFYDVSGWSMPLLGNLNGGYTGTRIGAHDVRLLDTQRVPAMPHLAKVPRIGLLDPTAPGRSPSESAGWARWRLQRDWHLPVTVLTPEQVTADGLGRLDVLLVPDNDAQSTAQRMGTAGAQALSAWVNGGGHYVGWRGGTTLAAQLGLSTVQLADPTSQVPGTLFRVTTAQGGPLTSGVGPTNEVMYEFDLVMRAADPADVVMSYPSPDSPDWFVSGYQQGAGELGGTAAEVNEP